MTCRPSGGGGEPRAGKVANGNAGRGKSGDIGTASSSGGGEEESGDESGRAGGSAGRDKDVDVSSLVTDD